MSISCVLEDIDLIFKIFQNLLDGSSAFSTPACSATFKIVDFQNVEISKDNIPENDSGFVLELFGMSW